MHPVHQIAEGDLQAGGRRVVKRSAVRDVLEQRPDEQARDVARRQRAEPVLPEPRAPRQPRRRPARRPGTGTAGCATLKRSSQGSRTSAPRPAAGATSRPREWQSARESGSDPAEIGRRSLAQLVSVPHGLEYRSIEPCDAAATRRRPRHVPSALAASLFSPCVCARRCRGVACAPIAAQTRNFIWKASGAQGTVYLVGSVHMLTKDYYPLSPALDHGVQGVGPARRGARPRAR